MYLSTLARATGHSLTVCWITSSPHFQGEREKAEGSLAASDIESTSSGMAIHPNGVPQQRALRSRLSQARLRLSEMTVAVRQFNLAHARFCWDTSHHSPPSNNRRFWANHQARRYSMLKTILVNRQVVGLTTPIPAHYLWRCCYLKHSVS